MMNVVDDDDMAGWALRRAKTAGGRGKVSLGAFFRQVDTDGSGTLDALELRRALRAIGRIRALHPHGRFAVSAYLEHRVVSITILAACHVHVINHHILFRRFGLPLFIELIEM